MSTMAMNLKSKNGGKKKK
jgi:hypothetical protein